MEPVRQPRLFFKVTATTDEEFEAQIEEVLRLMDNLPQLAPDEDEDEDEGDTPTDRDSVG